MRLAMLTALFLVPSMVAAQDAFGGGWDPRLRLGGGGPAKYKARASGGGNTACERTAITAGLKWLEKHQQPDGRWLCEHSHDTTVAVTSLGVLAMTGNGSTLRAGPWKPAITKAVVWLRENQKASGAFADASGPHLLAALAITECYLLSDYKLLKKNSVLAINYANLLRADDGGWRASIEDQQSDPALTLWGTTLLVTACDVELADKDNLCDGVFDWLRSHQANLTPNSGILGVAAPVNRQSELVYDQAAANAFTLCWLSLSDENPTTAAAMQITAAAIRKDALIRARALPRTWVNNPRLKLSINEWFCSAHALAQAGDQKSVAAICKSLAKAQVADGEDRGSWAPIGVWGEAGGRAWTTAMAVLTLEAPYRYAKITGM
tara:strand:+ start:55383 stop:56519 length:1137 start_codon:yes stop_codon:yes gene_type:complete